MTDQAITVLELNQRLAAAVAAAPGVSNVWVVAETSDLRSSGGHCYLELLDKDEEGNTRARIRANVWANVWSRIAREFLQATGTALTSGMRIMACVSANYHPAYGMSANITAVDPAYTLGEAVRRRNEIIARLEREGLLGLNRQLKWPAPALRVAVISAQGTAGYGDFINQLYTNSSRLRFTTRLFGAVMQGASTVPTVRQALRQIAEQADQWDCVVIIRGGGATSELAAFDDYDLAADIATFVLPVIVGIGHERDITVLDYVANMRVKTPTAAAEWLIERGEAVLTMLGRVGTMIYNNVSDRLAGERERLSRLEATLPMAVRARVDGAEATLQRLAVQLTSAAPAVTAPQRQRLDALQQMMQQAIPTRLTYAKGVLNGFEALLTALSPQATLRRGFSITYDADGHTVNARNLPPQGATITTVLAGDRRLTSTVTNITDI